MTKMTKVFFNTRSEARKHGSVKDSGINVFGKRWYIEKVQADPVLQEIFNAAAKHLLKQNVKSLSENTKTCMYRGAKGLMCAAGPFIAEVHYSHSLEFKRVGNDDVKIALKKSGFPVDNFKAISILMGLQRVHDSFDPKQWKDELHELANNHHLNKDALN